MIQYLESIKYTKMTKSIRSYIILFIFLFFNHYTFLHAKEKSERLENKNNYSLIAAKDNPLMKILNEIKDLKAKKEYNNAIKLLEDTISKYQNEHIQNRIYIELCLIYLELLDFKNCEINLNKVNKDILPKQALYVYEYIEERIKNRNNLKSDPNQVIFDYFQKNLHQDVIDYYESKNLSEKNNYFYNLVYAVSLRNKMKYDTSIKVLNEMEKQQNIDNEYILKAKIEKIISHFEYEDYASAIEQVEDIQKKKMTSNDSILKTLEIIKKNAIEIKERNQKIFNGEIGAGYVYDSNPNFSNSLNSVYLYTLQVTQGVISDNAFNAFGNLYYNLKVNKNFSLFGMGSGAYFLYQDVRDRNSLRLNFLQGFSFNYNKHGISMFASYQNMYLGKIDFPSRTFYDIYLGSLSYFYKYNKNLTLKLNYQFFWKSFPSFQYKNGQTHMLNLQADLKIDNIYLYLSLGSGYEKTAQNYYDNVLTTGYIGGRYYFRKAPVYIDVNYLFSMLNFTFNNPYLLNTKRFDIYHGVSSGVHFIPFKHLELYFSYNFNYNQSNISLYKYTRHYISTGFKILI